MQSPSRLFMLRPRHFGYNAQAATTNQFMPSAPSEADFSLALKEFDGVTARLESAGIAFEIWNEEPGGTPMPDAIFLNNWFSTHPDGRIITYPMRLSSRQGEKNPVYFENLHQRFQIKEVVDLKNPTGEALEGTGSLVFDYAFHSIYVTPSERTSMNLVEVVADLLQYKIIAFESRANQQPVYHTNVLMAMGERFAVLCLDAIPGEQDQERILAELETTNRKVIAISLEQMFRFAGNLYEVLNSQGQPVILISETALRALVPGQIRALENAGALLPVSVPTIEQIGGGSIRCMVAGNFLPPL